jgi:predicted nucleic acid-binding protein
VTIVLDASAAIHLVLNGPRAATVRAAIESDGATVAPDLYVAEVANALWKYVRAGQLDPDIARDSLSDATELLTRTVPSAELVTESLHEATRLGHPVYDLLYLVAARRNAATLATCDQRLHDLCVGEGLTVAGL